MTKVLNEGCATFSHFEIINKMYDEGYLSDGFMLEFLHNHSNVIFQPSFDSKYYSGLNPYTLGFNILKDIKRMSLEPTDEDYK
jgi:spore cortex formation protein SpoVR/YcgB (stage V sporulation)